jgi:predicted phage terminase large subunit-like protein
MMQEFAGLDPRQYTRADVDSVLCSRNFKDYVKAAWPVLEPATPFVPGYHIDAVCDHLEAVTKGQIRNLIINMPPRHMKSSLVSVLWPTWVWTTKPHLRWLYASYALQLSIRDSLYCRRIIESPWYQARWGHVYRLASDQSVKSRFDNTEKGYRIATSVGGSATGEGGDVLVCDDAHNVSEAESDVIREGVIDWYGGTMSTRLNDPKRGARVIVMQRVHQRDLAGYLLEQGGWELLCLPAEYEGNRSRTSLNWTDPRTEPGELLWPERFGPREIASLKQSLGTYKAAGQLQQRPTPAEGGLIKRDWWKWYDEAPKAFDQIVCSWDLAMKNVENADFTAGLVIGRKGSMFYVLDHVKARMDAPEQLRAIKALGAKWPTAVAKLIEDKANGPAVIALLRMEVPGVIAIKADASTGGKQARTMAVSPLIEAGQVLLPRGRGWADDLVEEAGSFPLGAHDDVLDALTQALSFMQAAAYMHTPDPAPDTRTPDEQHRAAIWERIRAEQSPQEDVQGPARYGGAW